VTKPGIDVDAKGRVTEAGKPYFSVGWALFTAGITATVQVLFWLFTPDKPSWGDALNVLLPAVAYGLFEVRVGRHRR
jgi:hypothetical protein